MKSAAILTLGLASLAASQVSAAVLLTIDTSNPAAVVFTSTGANSDATASTNAVSGVTLVNFFTDSGNTDFGPIGGNLAVDGVVSNAAGNDGPPPFGNGFNLYFATVGDPGNPSYSFISGTEAFTGTVTIDMTGMPLPANGATGTINIGRQGNGTLGAQVGTWEVVNVASPVPEPASAGLLAGLGMIGFAALRRRRK